MTVVNKDNWLRLSGEFQRYWDAQVQAGECSPLTTYEIISVDIFAHWLATRQEQPPCSTV
jgi:hypothetical protein